MSKQLDWLAMDKIEEELLKLSLSPEEVDEPELFLERIYTVETHEDLEVVRAMIHRRSTTEPPTNEKPDFTYPTESNQKPLMLDGEITPYEITPCKKPKSTTPKPEKPRPKS